MPYIPPERQGRSTSLPFLHAIPRWISMDEAEERRQQQSDNTRENARSLTPSIFRRHKSESSFDEKSDNRKEYYDMMSDILQRAANSDFTAKKIFTGPSTTISGMSDATQCSTSAPPTSAASSADGATQTEQSIAAEDPECASDNESGVLATDAGNTGSRRAFRSPSYFRNKVDTFDKSKSYSSSSKKVGIIHQTKTRFQQQDSNLEDTKLSLGNHETEVCEQKPTLHNNHPSFFSHLRSRSSKSSPRPSRDQLSCSSNSQAADDDEMAATTTKTINEPASQPLQKVKASLGTINREQLDSDNDDDVDSVDPLKPTEELSRSPSLSSLSSLSSLGSLANGLSPIPTTLNSLRRPPKPITIPPHTNEKVPKTTITDSCAVTESETCINDMAITNTKKSEPTKSGASRRAERPSLTRTTSTPGLEKRDFVPETDATPKSPATDKAVRAGSSEDLPSTVFSCSDSLSSPERRSSILSQLQTPVSPSIIRKKSGELVKSSLKLSSLIRNKSMPESSMKSVADQAIKNVHFDQKLEQVRHFLNSDRPKAVSDGSVKPRPHHHNHNGVGTFQWRDDESSSDEDDLKKGYDKYIARTEWSLSTPNFPSVPGPKPHTTEPDPMVYLESLFLSADKNNLVGHVAVKNIAFEKQVHVRYSLDYWQTVSQVDATYNDDCRKKLKDMGYDRFTFTINMNLLPQHILSQKPMHLCVRYTANGTEYWDNNNSKNFQLDFKRVPKPQRGPGRYHSRSKTEDGVGWTPKYSKASSDKSPQKKENVKPSESDDYGYEVTKSYSHDDSIPLKTRIPSKLRVLQRRNTEDHQNMFSRYDFGNSFRQKTERSSPTKPRVVPESDICSSPESSRDSSTQSSPSSAAGTVRGTEMKKSPSIGNLAAVMTGGVKPAVDSPSYQEMINKYCFFGSAPKMDEPEDYFQPGHGHNGSISSTSSTSSEDSILGMRPQQPNYMQSKISSLSSALSNAWPWAGAGSGVSSSSTTPTGEFDTTIRSATPTLGSSPTGSCLENSSPAGWAKGVEV